MGEPLVNHSGNSLTGATICRELSTTRDAISYKGHWRLCEMHQWRAKHPGAYPATTGFASHFVSSLLPSQGCAYSASGLITQVSSGFEIELEDHSRLFGPTLYRQGSVTSWIFLEVQLSSIHESNVSWTDEAHKWPVGFRLIKSSIKGSTDSFPRTVWLMMPFDKTNRGK